MDIDVRALLVQALQDKLNQVSYHQKEVSGSYLYANEREYHLKEIDRLKCDIQSDLYSIKSDLEYLEGQFNNLF